MRLIVMLSYADKPEPLAERKPAQDDFLGYSAGDPLARRLVGDDRLAVGGEESSRAAGRLLEAAARI